MPISWSIINVRVLPSANPKYPSTCIPCSFTGCCLRMHRCCLSLASFSIACFLALVCAWFYVNKIVLWFGIVVARGLSAFKYCTNEKERLLFVVLSIFLTSAPKECDRLGFCNAPSNESLVEYMLGEKIASPQNIASEWAKSYLHFARTFGVWPLSNLYS